MASAALDMSLDEIIKSNGKFNEESNGKGRGKGRGTIHRGVGVSRGYGGSKPSAGQIVWRPTNKAGTATSSPETTPKASNRSPSPETTPKASNWSPLPEAAPKASNPSPLPEAIPKASNKTPALPPSPGNARKSVYPLAELFVKSIKVPSNGREQRTVVSSPARPVRNSTPRQYEKIDDDVSDLGTAAGIETGTRLYVSNLDYGISNEDIKELFSEVGELKRCSINYDRIGRSKGTAEVVYTKKADAIAAIKRYNNVQLDGKPMKIEVIGGSLSENRSARSGGSNLTYRGGFGVHIAPRRAPAGLENKRIIRGRGGRGRGREGSTLKKTAEDLDADLENYHADTM
ncbi:hypothetical protein O6H91_10G005800 [Diphasiastrum complanatum]|uniref:Uncharacterized protein n=1 Tax=Diphasiastrum complanatum TaxID=34168 RepID=A0ACC2CEG1_DIPCM|nr:hypothetical protein O6H91_10G005800 [Diphasiastrum complanatum]